MIFGIKLFRLDLLFLLYQDKRKDRSSEIIIIIIIIIVVVVVVVPINVHVTPLLPALK
jgi:heme/copper-type cytochrome/quinol oxidase subunit 4